MTHEPTTDVPASPKHLISLEEYASGVEKLPGYRFEASFLDGKLLGVHLVCSVQDVHRPMTTEERATLDALHEALLDSGYTQDEMGRFCAYTGRAVFF